MKPREARNPHGRWLLISIFLIFQSSALSVAAEPIKAVYQRFYADPTPQNLMALKDACASGNGFLDFESDPDLSLDSIGKPMDARQIRGLVAVAKSKCVDGADAEALISVLGVIVLENYPVELIHAITQEKNGSDLKSLAADLAQTEPLELEDVDCDDSGCRAERREAFDKKRVALKAAKIDSADEPVRRALLAALDASGER